MSKEITSLAELQETNKPLAKNEQFLKSVASGGFLPRLQFMSASAPMCKSGKFPINHFAQVNGQDYTDLGEEIVVLVLAYRPKALNPEDGTSSFDPEDGLFLDIVEKANENIDNCMYGPEYLVYRPDTKEFCTILFGSKTTRIESPNMTAKLNNLARLTPKNIKTKDWDYWSMQVKNCSDDPASLPSREELNQQLEKFNNPPKQVVEKADESETAGDRDV